MRALCKPVGPIAKTIAKTNFRRMIASSSSRYSSSNVKEYSANNMYWKQQVGKSIYLGITEDYITEKILGDIDNISIDDSTESLNIEWSGLKCGEGDELYHSVWENTEGIETVTLQNIINTPIKKFSLSLNREILSDYSRITEDNYVFEIQFTDSPESLSFL